MDQGKFNTIMEYPEWDGTHKDLSPASGPAQNKLRANSVA